jgi:hypothetical protein
LYSQSLVTSGIGADTGVEVAVEGMAQASEEGVGTMRIQQYYSQIVSQGRRGTPTYKEAKRDLASVITSQTTVFCLGL